jgi:hypothetical protein
MAAIIKDNFRIFNSEQFYNSLSPSGVNNLYVYIGRHLPWGDENQPDTPIDNGNSDNLSWRDMLGLKRIYQSDVSHVIFRRDWISGTVYDEYAHDYTNIHISYTGAANLFDSSFYVVTDEFNVYKVLDNNNDSPSVVKPTGTPIIPFVTSDGYLWKYMYTVSPGDVVKFVSPDFIPVKTIQTADSSTQWSVQQAAVDGAIHNIKVVNGGTGYTTASVVISGDGSGATATATITSGVIDKITITNTGTGYRFATATISGDGSGATLSVIISPIGGHGVDPVYELGGYFLGINANLDYTLEGDLPDQNEYRRIGMILNPIDSSTGNVAIEDSLRASKSIKMQISGTGTFVQDELITGGTSGAKGYVIKYDNIDRVIYYSQNETTGFSEFQVGEVITGDTSGSTHTLSQIIEPEVVYDSGRQIFVEQRRPIVRDPNQAENIYMVVVF